MTSQTTKVPQTLSLTQKGINHSTSSKELPEGVPDSRLLQPYVPLHPKPFQLNIDPEIPLNGTLGIFGARGTGKTNCLTWLLKELRNRYPLVYLFTCTQFNSYWEQFLNPQYITNGWNDAVAWAILRDQADKVKRWRAGEDINPLCAVVLDDCLPKDAQWSDAMREIYFFGRHYMILSIANSQYFYAVPRGMRSNIDLCFSFKQDQKCQIEAFHEDYFCGYGKLDFFRGDFDQETSKEEGHQFLCFAVKDKSVDATERIYSGLADNMEEDEDIWFMGCPEYWRDNMEHLDKILKGVIRERARRKIDDKFFAKATPINNEISI